VGAETPPWLIGIFVAAIAALAGDAFRRSAADRRIIETSLEKITAAFQSAVRSIDANTASNNAIAEQMREVRHQLEQMRNDSRRGT
jgi:hypothetical protein